MKLGMKKSPKVRDRLRSDVWERSPRGGAPGHSALPILPSFIELPSQLLAHCTRHSLCQMTLGRRLKRALGRGGAPGSEVATHEREH